MMGATTRNFRAREGLPGPVSVAVSLAILVTSCEARVRPFTEVEKLEGQDTNPSRASDPDGSIGDETTPETVEACVDAQVTNELCRCLPGAAEPCDEHPGNDGRGQCRAGQRTCQASNDGFTSDWGACEGAVAPALSDSCSPLGDDSNCDGTPNTGCPCVEGQIIDCGPETDMGLCQRGTSTCIDGEFSACAGAVFPEPRDCGSSEDNDCDGLSDDTIDSVCTCTIGDFRACSEHPGMDGNGPCIAGQQQCEAGTNNATSRFGACIGAVGPAQKDSCSIANDDSDCSGAPNTGCQCIVGQGNGPCSADANASRCNSQGVCAPCEVNADCALISGGRTFCDNGRCTTEPLCGDGITAGSEVCDGGRSGATAVGSCNPECSGFYEERSILITRDTYVTNLGGIAGADAKCVAEFGPGFKALIVGGGRRASVTPFLGDGQQDWVLHKYTHYLNSDGALIWRTDDVALLAASGGRRQEQFADLWAPNIGFYPWAGFNDDWTTLPEGNGQPGSQVGTCNGWTTNDNTRWAGFQLQRLANVRTGTGDVCGNNGLLLCVEQ